MAAAGCDTAGSAGVDVPVAAVVAVGGGGGAAAAAAAVAVAVAAEAELAEHVAFLVLGVDSDLIQILSRIRLHCYIPAGSWPAILEHP